MEARLKEAIRKYVRERNMKKTLDEMSVTGNVAGYNTPAAFAKPGQTKKKNNRLASVTGSTVVNNLEEGEKDYALGQISVSKSEGLPMKKVAAKDIKGAEIADISGMDLMEDEDGLHLAENRWLAIKKEDGSPKAKMSKGITSIKQQLGEVEKFVNWYSKIKNENGVKRDDYYKRTNKSLHKIKERLMNLSEKIRTL
jgi:hypothetical protein